ncbi:MAG: HAMP domain-containing histidine kinase [Clostridiales bacterium]|jgi:signal transduction histidine kinase|nr:HAMP domain-containing histidine kinase [Clostridiales bacterium]
MLNKISLRLRLTILTCGVLTAVCACLTIISVFNASAIFLQPFGLMAVQPVAPVPVTTDDESTGETISPINAEAYRAFEASKKGFALQSILFMLVMTGVGTISTWFVAGKALKPVSTLSRIIEDIDEINLSTQIPVPQSKDEVARLAKSFNNMLEKIRKAFESKKRFSQNAAHELKTPLSSILANIEVMEIGGASASIDEYRETLLAVKQDAERMAVLTTDLLTLHAAGKPMDVSGFSIRDLLNSVLCDNDKDINKKKIHVHLEGEKEVVGNRFMLERAFSNIIQNAIRYNRDNGSITICCAESSIVVSDTGIGIPQDKLPHIFEPFYCADASRSRALGGSGLGLAITKEIFDKYDIKINVVSDENTGTTVTVTNL